MERDADKILNELLVLNAQQGDSGAIQLLVDRWHPQFIRYAQKLTQRQDVAADVVQECWITIFRGIHRLNDPANFSSWSYRIIRNKSVDWIRSQTRKRKFDQEASIPIGASYNDAREESSDLERLRNAIERLSPEKQSLLQMYYDDEMTLKEISEVLGSPVGTIKFRLFTLRNRLKEMIRGRTSDE